MEDLDLIKGSKVKEFIKSLTSKDQACYFGGDIVEKLNEKVRDLILDARYRAEQNDRVTVRGKDL